MKIKNSQSAILKMAVTFAILILFTQVLHAQTHQTKKENMTDQTLAKELGADDFGYRAFVIAYIKQGHKKTNDQTLAVDLQKQHLNYLRGLLDSGKLLVLGPILEEAEISGICIYNIQSVDEAKKLADGDPAVKAGEFVIELHPWYGPAALLKVPEINKKIEKKSFSEM